MGIFTTLVIAMDQLLLLVLLWSLGATQFQSIITFLVKFGIWRLEPISRQMEIFIGETTASDQVFTWSILIFVKTDYFCTAKSAVESAVESEILYQLNFFKSTNSSKISIFYSSKPSLQNYLPSPRPQWERGRVYLSYEDVLQETWSKRTVHKDQSLDRSLEPITDHSRLQIKNV